MSVEELAELWLAVWFAMVKAGNLAGVGPVVEPERIPGFRRVVGEPLEFAAMTADEQAVGLYFAEVEGADGQRGYELGLMIGQETDTVHKSLGMVLFIGERPAASLAVTDAGRFEGGLTHLRDPWWQAAEHLMAWAEELGAWTA